MNKRGSDKVENTVLETFKKSLVPHSTWPDKDEFLDVIYWIRQILGLVNGILWGILFVKGVVGLGGFLALNCAIVYWYCHMYQGVDDEEYGGITEIMKEGLMTSFATFLVSWIIVYSALTSS